DEAERLRQASEHLRHKADWAARRAGNFEVGALGEKAVAEALAPLSAKGWYLLHDRCSPTGGNLDHLAVGPPGVAVIDAKNWAGEIAVREGVLFAGGRARPKALDGVRRQVNLVSEVLTDRPGVKVRGFLALASDHHRGERLDRTTDIGVVGLAELARYLEHRSRSLDANQVEAALSTLMQRFPPSDAPLEVEVAPDKTSKTAPGIRSRLGIDFDLYFRTWYLRPWRTSRLYLKNSGGEDLGWKDIATGTVTLSCAGDDARLGETVLKAATLTGTPLAASDLPRVPVRALGSRLLGQVSRSYVGLLLGQEWRKGNQQRIYGHLIDRAEGHFELGYVDVSTGALHPSVEGNLNKSLGQPRRYLERLRNGAPQRQQPPPPQPSQQQQPPQQQPPGQDQQRSAGSGERR
ncbi:MAG: nuclease-related domain-containing protein, partial [Acidimicrobiales bacterium]